MNPEIERKFQEMQDQIDTLRSVVTALTSRSDIDPQIARTVELIVGNESTYAPTDYDQVVNEAGSSSYQVPREFDGLALVNGKLIGYYNP